MKLPASRRKGIILVGVVVLMGIVLGLISVLALMAGHGYRHQRNERNRAVARAMVDSGAAYARAHFQPVPASMPAEPIELDVRALLPDRMQGSLSLAFAVRGGRPTCRITARVDTGGPEATDALDFDLAGSPDSRPATQAP